MVKSTPATAYRATPVREVFDLQGATVYGGAGPLVDFALDGWNLGVRLEEALGDLKAPNATYSAGFDATLLSLMRPLGFIRPQDFGGVAHDPYLADKLGVERLPDPSSINRSLHRFEGEDAREALRSVVRDAAESRLLLGDEPPYSILDVDSSVEVVYGEHVEGASKGYNPRARGRKSYHPLIFTEGCRDLVLGAWLRQGRVGDSHDLLGYLEETVSWLERNGRPVRYFRADRGFQGEKTFAFLEVREIGYAMKIKTTARMRRAWDGLEYTPISNEGDVEEIEALELSYRATTWKRSRRVVVVRRRLRDPDELWLPGCGWRIECVVTNLDWSPEDVWRFYNRRCQAENLIKELKEGYGIDQISTGSFGANDADLVLKVLSYNLVRLFQCQVLPAKWSRLRIRTLRTCLLRIAGRLVHHARRLTLRLASWFPNQEEFRAIRERLAHLLAET